jgi:hypothetical protein
MPKRSAHEQCQSFTAYANLLWQVARKPRPDDRFLGFRVALAMSAMGQIRPLDARPAKGGMRQSSHFPWAHWTNWEGVPLILGHTIQLAVRGHRPSAIGRRLRSRLVCGEGGLLYCCPSR